MCGRTALTARRRSRRREKGLRSRIHLSEREKQGNDPFVGSGPSIGAQSNDMAQTAQQPRGERADKGG